MVVNALANTGLSSFGGGGYHTPQQPRIYDGVEICGEMHGCEVYYYAQYGLHTSCARLAGLNTTSDLYQVSDVVNTLSTYVDPMRPSGANMLCFNAARGSGVATTVHMYCRQNSINLIDCHNTSGLPEQYEKQLVKRVQDSRDPFVLMMHRFDEIWTPQTRFEAMGRLVDCWNSLSKISENRVRSLVWVTSLGGVVNVFPPLASVASIVSVTLHPDSWNREDNEDMIKRMLSKRAPSHSLTDDDILRISAHTDVLHTPGRVYDLVKSVLDSGQVTAKQFEQAIKHFRTTSMQ